jgi:hypothetical protein
MSQTQSRSLQQIKQDTELTRAGLTATVEQLRNSITDTAEDVRGRIKPDAIKAEVSHYFRNRGEKLLSDVTEAARRNPMQAVAVGAAVAYPLIRIVRTIPVPVLMVGAGLYFAGSRGQSLTQKARTMASDQLDRATAAVSEGIDGLTGASSKDTGIATRSGEVQDRIQSSVTSISDSAGALKERGARMANSATGAAQDFAENAASAARRAVQTTAESGLEVARSARERAADLAQTTSKTFRETIEQNPLAVAGVGLLLGALIASLLPRSQVEDQLIGGTSAAMKKRAQAAASEGFEAAKGAVRESYDEGTRQAETTDDVRKAAQEVGERVRHVAESAVTTAFEPGQDQDQAQSENQRRFTE